MSRPFRVELNDAKRNGPPLSTEVARILQELQRLRDHPAEPPAIDEAIAVWSGIDDIQRRLDVTKAEINAIHVHNRDKGRSADELRAVVRGTEAAADRILAAAEEIDEIAQRHLGSDDEEACAEGERLAACVVEIFEACNFQDITGQRISKVVASLQFVEQRIATMVDVWLATEQALKVQVPPGEPEGLLNGPALEGDHGVVSQEEVDALFR